MAAADAIAQLDRRFGIPGVAQVVAGNGGLPCVRINSPVAIAEKDSTSWAASAPGFVPVNSLAAAGEMYLHGAHVTSWKPPGADEVLFVSSRSRFEDGWAIRGGVPICFPWFADRVGDPKSPAHGLVRTKAWQLDSIAERSGAVTVAMHTNSDEATKQWWPGDFHLVCRATFGVELSIELVVENMGTAALRFEEALHTYFRVGDINAARLGGLNKIQYLDKTDANREKPQQGGLRIVSETDRIYLNTAGTVELVDPALARRAHVAKQNSLTTVIWNPWIAKSQAMSDFGDSEWKEMVCIETCNVGAFAVELAPGQRHTMRVTVRIESLVRQLYDESDRTVASAVGCLLNYPDVVLREMPRFFELTLHRENTPTVSGSWVAINRTKSSAVPFLLEQAKSADGFRRQRAIELLGTVGAWCGGTTLLAIQELQPRPELPPDWGTRADDVLNTLTTLLADPNLSVRFAAASVLESLNRSLDLTIPIFIDTLLNGTILEKNWAALRLGRFGPPARSACAALSQLAACPLEPDNIWSKYANLAAQVALKKIG